MPGDEAKGRPTRDGDASERSAERDRAIVSDGALDPTVVADRRNATTVRGGRTQGPPTDPSTLPAQLQKIKAYEVLGPIGGGGMGVVYRARDLARDQVVALKTLSSVSEESFASLKQEFRAAADIAHENLVTLHELLLEEGVPYFTMELVEGTDFVTYVRGEPRPRDLPPEPLDEEAIERLRAVARQLALGVSALHAVGKLHRDLKPTNVMVTPAGRVVILDFGLALDAHPEAFDHRVVGTPAYMAPEQTTGKPTGPAADWYAVGVMIFQALTGELPFGRTVADLVRGFVEPPRPSNHVAVPADLDDLCVELLVAAPELRPDGAEVLRRLGAAAPAPAVAPGVALVGRQSELARLHEAFDASSRGAVAVLVEGPSGLGKSALVRRFLDDVAGEATILRSRCHERESFSFKAFDGIVEGLADRLRARAIHAGGVEGGEALARLFPTLQSIVGAAPAQSSPVDPQTLRQSGFRALKQLLTEVSERRPLILWIDDVQWSDGDSADLLGELLAEPTPRILWIATTRSEHAGGVAFSRALERAAIDLRKLPLERLSPEAAIELADAAAGGALTPDQLEVLAGESLGNPLLLEQLVRDAVVSGAPRRERLSLEEIVLRRLDRLPQDARRLLEAIAVGGRIPQQVAFEVAAPEGDPWAAVAVLRVESLIRTQGTRGLEELEPWHDGIRDAIADHLPTAERASRHGAIAEALAREAGRRPGRIDAAQLATHFHAAGRLDEAGRHALAAARDASKVLAFDRAAKLYGLARHCGAGEPRELMRLEADALVHGGRCAEAAPLYRIAADLSTGQEALDLRRLAAEQLLVSGRVDEGVAALKPVLRALGLEHPPTPAHALASLLWQLAKLELRSVRFERHPHPDERLLRQIDLCWSAGKGLLSYDAIRAAHYVLRMLFLALKAGEPHRASLALAIVGMMIVFDGDAKSHRKGMRLIEEGERIAPPGDDYLEGIIQNCRGTAEMSIGHFERGMAMLESGIEKFERDCTSIRWECSAARSSIFTSLSWTGDVAEMRRRAAAYHRNGEQMGDLFLTVTSELYDAFGLLAEGRPEASREISREAIRKWAQDGYHYQHWFADRNEIRCDLYEGEVRRAAERCRAAIRRVRRAGSLRVLLMAVDALLLDGRVTLAAVRAGVAPARRIRQVLGHATKLEGFQRPLALAAAADLRAQVALVRGDRRAAREGFTLAAARYADTDVGMHALVARRSAALLAGDPVTEIDAAIRALGVVDPARWCRVYAETP